MTDATQLPIALFDSGMGGLTVFKAIADTLPAEDLLYLGDTARLPYGTKGRETIIRYTLKAAEQLVQRGVKMLVVACNTATATALPTLREHVAPLPVVGVVEPGATAACAATRNGHIAVIATEATIKSGVYHRAITAIRPDARISGKPCTLFVPLAEEGLNSGPIVAGIAHHYLDEIFAGGDAAGQPDTLLLGCTHFPLFEQALQEVVGPAVRVVNPAATVAQAVAEALQSRGLCQENRTDAGRRHFMTTDNQERFARTGSIFLGSLLSPDDVELVDL